MDIFALKKVKSKYKKEIVDSNIFFNYDIKVFIQDCILLVLIYKKQIGVDSMTSDIKIRKVNQTDAIKWFKFVNKIWINAYKNIFPEEVF